ncbi:hypothetical protein DFP72DRAFT_401229 [Ephemerocybe angulata]|uniref:Uncharacterized protein n=1 Tax=Ephemerocybe angulata TaxID=980116 RepID=A0A8H6M305_9AGAR|nr:hypothetical protein DFP72DRAFT_401229 [Tulosesus angulatus]
MSSTISGLGDGKQQRERAWQSLSQWPRAPYQNPVCTGSAPVTAPPASQQLDAPQCITLEEDELTRCSKPATNGYPSPNRLCREHYSQYRLHYNIYKEAQNEAKRFRRGREMPTASDIAKCTSRHQVMQKRKWVWLYAKAIGVELRERAIHSKRFFLAADYGHESRIQVLEEEIEKAHRVIEMLGERALMLKHQEAVRAHILKTRKARKNAQAQSQPSPVPLVVAFPGEGTSTFANDGGTRVDGDARNGLGDAELSTCVNVITLAAVEADRTLELEGLAIDDVEQVIKVSEAIVEDVVKPSRVRNGLGDTELVTCVDVALAEAVEADRTLELEGLAIDSVEQVTKMSESAKSVMSRAIWVRGHAQHVCSVLLASIDEAVRIAEDGQISQLRAW